MAEANGFEKLKMALGPPAGCPPLPELAFALDLAETDHERQFLTRRLEELA